MAPSRALARRRNGCNNAALQPHLAPGRAPSGQPKQPAGQPKLPAGQPKLPALKKNVVSDNNHPTLRKKK